MKTIEKDPKKRLSAIEALQHPWLANEQSQTAVDATQLEHVSKNLASFCQKSQFHKMIISILSSLKAQKRELTLLKNSFNKIDEN
jgi:serine/threonine protein kinase